MTPIENQGSLKSPLNENKVVIKRVIATLPWDNLTYSEQLVSTKHIDVQMTGNTDFPLPWPANVTSLATLETDIGTFDDNIVAAKTRAKGTSEAEELSSKKAHKDLLSIMRMVQTKMDDKPEEALRICTDAGFGNKSRATRGKRKREAKPGNIPGSLIVTDEGAGKRQWQQSPDEGKAITHLDPTTGGKTTATGLTSLQFYWFRCRLVLTKGRYGDWTPWFGAIAP
jgi:hypothetical protein